MLILKSVFCFFFESVAGFIMRAMIVADNAKGLDYSTLYIGTSQSLYKVMKDEVLKFDRPEVRFLPPTDRAVAPVQRPCFCGQSFLDKYRSQYSYTTFRQPAKELHKYMTHAIEVLEKKVFNVNEEMEILSLSTKNILTDGMLFLQGALVLEALAVA